MSVQRTPTTRHGRDGWVLEDYDWFCGEGRYEYAKYSRGNRTECVEFIAQPYSPAHEGWDARPTSQGVLTLRP